MDKHAEYRAVIQRLLQERDELTRRSPEPGVESLFVCDTQHDIYLLMDDGWSQGKRVRNTYLSLRLRNDKIYVEEDWTDSSIVDDLLASGVPKEDIVLAWQPPEMRQYTEFAAA